MRHARKRRPRKPPRGMLPAEREARAEPERTVHVPPFEYRARAGQAELHADPARFKVVVAHRRFGKTVFAVNQLVRAAADALPGATLGAPRFAYVAHSPQLV